VLERAGVVFAGAPLVGLAPNLRVYERMPGEGAENAYVRFLCAACRFFIDTCGATVVLIPHETRLEPEIDDDRRLARLVAETLDVDAKLCRVEGAWTAADLKSAVGRLEFLLASRFHAMVGALSMQTPVVAAGWSHKYGAQMSDVGLSDCAMAREDVVGSDLARLREAWRDRERLKAVLERRVPELERAAADALAYAGDVFEGQLT
jgi:polysaccharide pyruvyl transferase WcaK-like protein